MLRGGTAVLRSKRLNKILACDDEKQIKEIENVVEYFKDRIQEGFANFTA